MGGSRNAPCTVRFHDSCVRSNGLSADQVSVGVKVQPVGACPGRAKHLHAHLDLTILSGGQVAHPKSVIHLHLDQQSHADVCAHFTEALARLGQVDLFRSVVGAFHIGTSLPKDKAADIMCIAGSDSRDVVAPVEHCEPVTVRSHNVRLHRGRSYHLHCVKTVWRPIKIASGHGVEVFRRHWAKTAVDITWMI